MQSAHAIFAVTASNLYYSNDLTDDDRTNQMTLLFKTGSILASYLNKRTSPKLSKTFNIRFILPVDNPSIVLIGAGENSCTHLFVFKSSKYDLNTINMGPTKIHYYKSKLPYVYFITK